MLHSVHVASNLKQLMVEKLKARIKLVLEIHTWLARVWNRQSLVPSETEGRSKRSDFAQKVSAFIQVSQFIQDVTQRIFTVDCVHLVILERHHGGVNSNSTSSVHVFHDVVSPHLNS